MPAMPAPVLGAEETGYCAGVTDFKELATSQCKQDNGASQAQMSFL